MNWSRKLAGPGLFRLVLASIVVVHHASRFGVGGSAVYIFFCLSGYWICKMWRERYSKTTRPYITYLVSRGWRLIPTFVLIAAISIVVELILGQSMQSLKGPASWGHFILSHAFILGYDMLPKQPMVPAWSLDFEMQFYILAPLIVAAISRSRRPLVVLGLAALCSLASAHWLGHHALSSYLVFFIIGIIAAHMNWHPSVTFVSWSSSLGVLILVGCVLSPYRGVILIGAHPGPYATYNLPANISLALLMSPLAIYTTGQAGFASDGMFADLSYIVYLLHWSGNQILSRYQMFKFQRVTLTAIVLTAVYILAFGIWKLYDKPINRLRSKWVSGRRQIRASELTPASAPIETTASA